MTSELPSSNQQNQSVESLDERFAHRPGLRRRLLAIADMIDQAVTEARAMEPWRQLGNEVLTDWAEKSEQTAESMLQLRARRANKDWEKYWPGLAKN